MYYIPYLVVKSQLVDRSRAKLIVEGVEVFIQTSSENKVWTFEAKIGCQYEQLTDFLKDNLMGLNDIKSQFSKALLRAYPEDGFVLISQKFPEVHGYLEFKNTMELFMTSFDFWKSVVDDVVNHENLLTK